MHVGVRATLSQDKLCVVIAIVLAPEEMHPSQRRGMFYVNNQAWNEDEKIVDGYLLSSRVTHFLAYLL